MAMSKPDYIRPAAQITLPVVTLTVCLCGIVGALVALVIFRLTSVPL
jgi:hypothetical protein